jgi:hypothetical protein
MTGKVLGFYGNTLSTVTKEGKGEKGTAIAVEAMRIPDIH